MEKKIRNGIDAFHRDMIVEVKGKKVGIVGNHSSVSKEGVHIFEILKNICISITLFGPEHSFFGDVEDRKKIANQEIDNEKGDSCKIKVFSLFGDYKSPSKEMMKNVDIMLYDIQDVGVRFYTFVYTLYHVMLSCKRYGKKIYVLDRVNLISGSEELIEGPISFPTHCGFFSPVPLPIRYSMTIGEMAMMFNNEKIGCFPAIKCDLEVVKIEGEWNRKMFFNETKLNWLKTSPCIKTFETTVVYPGFCLFEGTNISEGRGTDLPFLTIGSPFLKNPMELLKNSHNLMDGVEAKEIIFTPKSIEKECTNPKYLSQRCVGLRFKVINPKKVKSVSLTLWILVQMKKKYEKEFKVLKFMDKLWGSEKLRQNLNEKESFKEIIKLQKEGIESFKIIRKKYMIYK